MTGGTEGSLGLITTLFPVRLTRGTVVPKCPTCGTVCLSPRDVGAAGLGCEELGRHLHGEVSDEGFPEQLYLEGRFLNSVGSVDHPAGDNSMSESG